MIEQKYPSGRVVKNVLDNDGDLSIVQSKKNVNSGYFNYAKNFTYTAAGAVSSMQLGNGKWESAQFNSRLQPTQIALGTVQNGTDKLKLDFTYNTTGQNDNNGNVLSQTITVPTVGSTPGFTAVQTYTYDELNRIHDAKENIDGNPTANWKQTFDYDRYGNRRFNEANTDTIEANCPTAICNPQIDTTKNRLVGYTFDDAGNTKIDAQGKTFTYDAENKQIEVKNASNITIGEYFYDGDGKRVKKKVGNEVTIFVYDASGKMVAEYATTVVPQSQAKVSYLTTDHLGSPRINTDTLGQVTARHDYQPFGEEIQRVSYGNDDVKQKFTSYERDIETDLDFAEARYYSSPHGRFTSVDTGAFVLADPQNWNRYAYVQNNPTKFIDPTGKDLVLTGDDADYIVGELANATGYKLTRCTAVDAKSGCKKVGQVLIDKSTGRNKNKTSKNLANKLKEIIGDKKHVVSIGTGRNQAGVFFDSFSKREIDVADYDEAKKAAPEFATRSLGHVLEEYYQAETTFSNLDEDEKYKKSHDKALEFESKVISDFTGKDEQKRVNEFKPDGTVKYIYTTVEYDVIRKTGVGTDKSLSNIDKITKTVKPTKNP